MLFDLNLHFRVASELKFKMIGLIVIALLILFSFIVPANNTTHSISQKEFNFENSTDLKGTRAMETIPITVSPKEYTKVRLETNYGNIDLEIYDDRAPVTAGNFLKYVNDGFYDGLIFHRVIYDFVIQGGGFTPDMNEKNPTYPPIRNEASEAKLRNLKGTLAAARTSDPDSATSQFYINLVDNEYLDWDGTAGGGGYCVFGNVTDGMKVVEDIAKLETQTENGYSDVPVSDVIISRAYVLKDSENGGNGNYVVNGTSTESVESESWLVNNFSAIIFGVSGLIAAIVIIMLVAFFWSRKKGSQQHTTLLDMDTSYSSLDAQRITPISLQDQPYYNQTQPPPTCPQCSSKLMYIEQYQKWYCDRCNSYH